MQSNNRKATSVNNAQLSFKISRAL
jgi:hypothetical protein